MFQNKLYGYITTLHFLQIVQKANKNVFNVPNCLKQYLYANIYYPKQITTNIPKEESLKNDKKVKHI